LKLIEFTILLKVPNSRKTTYLLTARRSVHEWQCFTIGVCRSRWTNFL